MGRHSRRSPREAGDPSGAVPPSTPASGDSAPQHPSTAAHGLPRYGAAQGTPPDGTPRPAAAHHTPPPGPGFRVPRRPGSGHPTAGHPTPGRGTPVPGTPAPGTPPEGTAVPGTPAHGFPRPQAAAAPQDGRRPGPDPVTPARGTPLPAAEVRGGHPQHPEDTGAFDRFGPGGGSPAPRPAGRFPQGGPAAPTARTYGTYAVGSPRQEYIDAFEDEVYFRGATERTDTERTGTHSRVPGARTEDRVPDGEHGPTPPGEPGDTDRRYAEDDDPRDDEEPDERATRRGRRGWGRTLSGVTAAAVTTVLAVVVAGEVTGGESAQDDRTTSQADVRRAGDDDSSRSQARDDAPGGTSPRDRAPARPTYAQLLDRPVALDPELRASGKFSTVPGTDRGAGKGTVVRYRVDVEKGVPVDGAFFAKVVHRTLNDERSWAHEGARSFDRVSSGDADFVITLASPGATADWCAKSGLDTTVDNVSCDSAATERVMINAYRWAQGSETYGDEMAGYRQMLINHEVGHRLGRNHEQCTEDGAPAPVMMQQTKTLTTGNNTCRPNAWPF